MQEALFILLPCIAIVALLYSMVGHGGASGYIAVMALCAWPAAWIRQDALMLNLGVSAIATWHFARKGHFNGSLFWPLVLASVPMAFLGAKLNVETEVYKTILGVCLLIPAAVFLWGSPVAREKITAMPLWAGLGIGAALGFLSGITGIGGGVFLSPILLLGGWAGQKTTAATSAPFILLNSISGLLGTSLLRYQTDISIAYMLALALAGGFIGAYVGAGKLSEIHLKRLLGLVLVWAALKLIFQF
jgi:uncharacterized membrane protein YfcA